MLSEPKFVTRPDQPFAAIRVNLDRSELSTKAPPLIDEVAGWLQSQGVEPVGAPFFNYLEMGAGERLELEVGFPTARQLDGDARVRAGIIPGGRFATLTHTGPYEGLDDANVALGDWLGKQGVQHPTSPQAGGEYGASLLEIYETDPDEEPNPANWVTEVAFRLGD